MKIEFDIITLLDTIGFVQGVSLGILLFVLNRPKRKSTFFLGLFLTLFALQRLPFILPKLNLYEYYPELYLLPLNFFWLLLPLFYVYSQQVSIFTKQRTKYWLLYPGIVAFLVQVVLFLLPTDTKTQLFPNLWLSIFFITGAVYGWIVGIYNLRLISLHSIEVRNCYAMLESKELKWARTFLYFSIIGSMLYLTQLYLIPENAFSRIYYIIFDLTIIYWVAYHGVVQRNVLSILAKADSMDFAKNQPNEETAASAIPIKELENLMVRIDEYMQKSECFVKTELTLMNVAEELKIHPKRISTAINGVRNQNFNYYVNKLRIKKAEKLLKDRDAQHLSVEGIGHEVGFHSKSAFYMAFKKFTGTTPTKFKKNLAA